MRKKGKVAIILCLGVLLILLSVILQLFINNSIARIPDRPIESDTNYSEGGLSYLMYAFDQVYRKGDSSFSEGLDDPEYLYSQLEGNYNYIASRFDCADFRASALIRFYLENEEYLPEETREDIKNCLLEFKYWMDEPGEDSMCYWSENHQILFASTEYLVAQRWPDEVFQDGRSGREHLEDASARIYIWMDQRFRYGFTEYYSNNYYPEDIGPMSNIIQFSQDDDMRLRMSMIMDLLIYDMASQNYQHMDEDGEICNIFMSASGRMYFDNKASDQTGNRMSLYSDLILENATRRDEEGTPLYLKDGGKFFNSFKHLLDSGLYEVPEVLKRIYQDSRVEQIVKASNGLYLEELEAMGLVGQKDEQIMMQWGMEAFCNPEVIDNSISYIARNNMFGNYFLNDFKLVNLWPLRAAGALGMVSKLTLPYLNGSAIERGNVYTYQCPYYSMSTTQAHLAGNYGDQHQTNLVTIDDITSIFHNHPMQGMEKKGYWMGHGRMPYSVQEENISLSIYCIPDKRGLMEGPLVDYTHAYFPKYLFDSVDESHMKDGYIFAEKSGAYIALIAGNPLYFNSSEQYVHEAVSSLEYKGRRNDVYDLVQEGGDIQYFIIELSDERSESFNEFKTRILSNTVEFDSDRGLLSYVSGNRRYEALYDSYFAVDGFEMDLEYERMESAYVVDGVVERYSDVIEFCFEDCYLHLDWAKGERKIQI